MVEYKNLIVTREEGLALITLNRPEYSNALNTELLGELEQVLWELERDRTVRAVIITGKGKAFAAGADVRELVEADPWGALDNCSQAHRVFDRVEGLPCPTIAAINGPALGGGCELALCCDFRVAGESGRLGLPEISLGIIPGAGGTQRLVRLVGVSRAKEMIYLGSIIDARKAWEIGLVDRVVGDQEVMEEARRLAARLMEKPRVALSLAKKAINFGRDKDLESGKRFEMAQFALAFSTRDQKEGMRAFVEKRKPNFVHE
ncbi:MAG: enoyl-CoA hydratase/isomerase family protein [Moorellaceae bacterium]